LRVMLGDSVRRVEDEVTNVFVAVIGDYAFVEFSTTGNALYVYLADDLPFKLERHGQTVAEFKDQQRAQDRLVHAGRWEDRAIDLVGGFTGVWP
jgi:hypothetical protein